MKRLLTLAALAVLWALPVLAMESAPVSSPRAVATLVSETDAIQPGQPFRVGLNLRMADGWHTYWKNPGDAGAPPELTIEGGTAIPDRLADAPARRRGAGDDLRLYRPGAAAGDRDILHRRDQGHAQWLVCKEICVPEEGDFTLNLPVGTPAPSPQAALFAAHDRAVPRASPWAARIAPDGTLFVQGPELRPATVTDAWFIPDQPGHIQDDAAQPLSVRNGGFTLSLKPSKGFEPIPACPGVLSVRDRTGMQTDVVINAAPGPAPAPAMPPLGQVLVFAWLGGLILNLMPCVFPILAMKAVALARHGGRGHAPFAFLHRWRAGHLHGPGGAAAGRTGGGFGGGLGVPVLLADIRRGDDLAAVRASV